MKLRTTCPRCSRDVPFLKTQWGLGKPFACTGCGTKLVIERNYWLPFAALCAFWFGRVRMESPAEQIGLFAGLLVGLAVTQALVMKPILAEPDRL
jgi:DNA-directed RNA polymerase subunit RPC12/RpoP